MTLKKFVEDNQVIQYGDFQLSSGLNSKFYLDGRKVTLNPVGLRLVAKDFKTQFKRLSLDFQLIGGPMSGADPIVAALCMAFSVQGFLIRKEPKSHGLKKMIEGDFESGMNAVLVEDVTTTGKSLKKAFDIAKENGINVVAVGTIFDRNMGANKLFDVPFISLMTIS